MAEVALSRISYRFMCLGNLSQTNSDSFLQLSEKKKVIVPLFLTCFVYFFSLFSARRALYTGDSSGRVFIWVLPDGSGGTHCMQPGRDTVCVNCQSRFPLLERRFNCKTCGGVFCGTCTFVPTSGFVEKQARFCFKCSGGKLKELMG